MAQITEAEVAAAGDRLQKAKKARGTTRGGAKADAAQEAAQALADIRSAFRAQEESAGRRTGITGGDTKEGK